MEQLKDFLKEISDTSGVSGFEEPVAKRIKEKLTQFTTDIRVDALGNIVALKKGSGKGRKIKVMMSAHMDEIGLMVTEIKDGFLRVSAMGGVDPRTMLGQEVIIHGRENLPGIIGTYSPLSQEPSERKKGVKIEKLFIDTGFKQEELEKRVRVGDVVSVRRSLVELSGNNVAGKALDDRAGVTTLLACLQELEGMIHGPDLYIVASVQEEVGVRGATTATFGIVPDIGIAIDVCHGNMSGVPEHETSNIGKGPVVTIGPNIHPNIAKKLMETGKEYNIDTQKEIATTATGTDARAMQITKSGIATGLLSLPLRYMHTSVELGSLNDIKQAGRLLAYFTRDCDQAFVEGLKCF